MKELLERNYQSTVKRGLIDEFTSIEDFLAKIEEEVLELWSFYDINDKIEPFELADIILVCLNMATHFKIDIEAILMAKVRYNEKRED